MSAQDWAQRPRAATGGIRGARALTHPGDSYSYDMFSQAGQAIRDRRPAARRAASRRRSPPLSQSAGRLVTYIDAVHPVAQVYDGFRPQPQRLGRTPGPGAADAVRDAHADLIRDDLDAGAGLQHRDRRGLPQARQPDSATYRLWVVGTATDQYGLLTGADRHGTAAPVAAWFDTMLHPTNRPNPGLRAP